MEAAPAKTQGFGSIWNNNSWFYEEKNFTKFAKEYLTAEMCKLTVTKNDAEVSFYEMKSIEGDASVTIRKQKQIFLYSFEMELYFQAHKVSDPETKCKGKVKIHEFNQDDDEINMDITQETQSDFVSATKKVLNNEVTEAMLKTFGSLQEAMRLKDADEIKLKQDAAEREQAKLKA